ncbi:methyl-accepting chemotaxis protein [Kineococcus sp. SYSU DK018]|uniref:methyl-accepting chemotaxis protein n=1 Tax=Kineococcus sp. SYSU DK018 TaxID=3383139 RepID=UPI003D7C38F6
MEVQALVQASRAVGEVIEIVPGIADQANPLVLNATVEAARRRAPGRAVRCQRTALPRPRGRR